jgi:hypothetical protein
LKEDSNWLPNKQYVWGIRYIDELILRDQDTSSPINGTLNQRHDPTGLNARISRIAQPTDQLFFNPAGCPADNWCGRYNRLYVTYYSCQWKKPPGSRALSSPSRVNRSHISGDR